MNQYIKNTLWIGALSLISGILALAAFIIYANWNA